MKKFISILTISILLFCMPVFASDSNEKVEISFKVGDSTLLINGQSVTVETPFVAGDGHTLVPLRVITEAFGATVDWEGEEKKIFLSYPDVDITLQIDNLAATVNTHTETLPIAPILSKNGVTMVPLRFISETFGADVSYDETTKAITVVKDNSKKSDISLSGITELPRVGDSYYNWSMDTPKEMFMSERSFDGLYTEYVSNADENNYISIFVNYKDEDLSFEKDYSMTKDNFKNFTLLKADKLTDDNNNQYMHFRIKDSVDQLDYRKYYLAEYTIEIMSNASVDSEEIAYINSIADSFKASFTDKSQTYDLSNIGEDGYRVYKNEKYKLSFKVPKDLYEAQSNAENEMSFFSVKPDDPASLNVAVYSKTDGLNAESLAKKDLASNKKYTNKDLVSFSSINSCLINNVSGYEYTMEISGTAKQDNITYDIFFEKGNYVYNVSISSKPLEKGIRTIIVPSFSAEELNFDDIGILLRNDYEEEGTYTSSGTYLDLTLPLTWEELVEPTNNAMYMHKAIGAVISVFTGPVKDVNTASMEEYVVDAMNSQISTGYKISKKLSKEKIGLNTYYTFVLKKETDGITTYTHCYAMYLKKGVVIFTLGCDQILYSDTLVEEFKEIIKTLSAKY